MARTILYDPGCEKLARSFLIGEALNRGLIAPETDRFMDRHAPTLAQHIQTAIEHYLQFDLPKAKV